MTSWKRPCHKDIAYWPSAMLVLPEDGKVKMYFAMVGLVERLGHAVHSPLITPTNGRTKRKPNNTLNTTAQMHNNVPRVVKKNQERTRRNNPVGARLTRTGDGASDERCYETFRQPARERITPGRWTDNRNSEWKFAPFAIYENIVEFCTRSW